jgi:alkylation response protein AidB-like acyl-CoA dehydrogenase
MPAAMEFTMEDVQQHCTREDNWMVIDGVVLDVSKFGAAHPGGAGILKMYAGKDATKEFFAMHKATVLQKYQKRLKKGVLKGAKVLQNTKNSEFGKHLIDVAPYSEPAAWLGWHSPYWKDSHKKMRLKVRAFIQDEIVPEGLEAEELGEYPSVEIYQTMGKFGLLAARVGKDVMKMVPGLIELEKHCGVKAEEFDHFHELLVHEEFGHMVIPSWSDGLCAGFNIGAPPILHFAPPAIRDKVMPELLLGDKRVALAISEPWAGSDVAGAKAVATPTEDGKFYRMNGVKKWITNGMFADYFVVAAHTVAPGAKTSHKTMSMILVDRSMGVETKAIKTSYNSCAGTALVFFDDVLVPKENLMGPMNTGVEGAGFFCVMANFNHERWMICASAMGAMRTVIADSFKWCVQRDAFGKSLITQPVVRQKLAVMAGAVESAYAMLENVTYQMDVMGYKEQSVMLGGPIALLKYQVTRSGTVLADNATQLLGGRGITKTGMGRSIEAWNRTYKYASILGGSEEVMADLAIRQQLRGKGMGAKL